MKKETSQKSEDHQSGEPLEKMKGEWNPKLDFKNPAVLRDQAAQYIKKLQCQNPCSMVKMTPKQWKQLHEALNLEESLEALSKNVVDKDDINMREGMGIL